MTRFSKLLLATAALAFVLPAPGHSSVAAKHGWNASGQHGTFDRRKKRVKGGSGCDDPGDAAEHPECR